jgi:hypothetical protein
MMLELRRESQKHRDMTTANQREIAKLKRKEKSAIEATKRLEKSNVIQRAMLKRRNDEVIKSQNKLKSVLGLLKRSATPNRIFKTITSGVTSPSHTRLQSRQEDRGRKRHFTGPAISELLSAPFSTRISVPETVQELNASVEIRAQFKKQMVDKELEICILCRRTQKKLGELHALRVKLVGEQRELMAERDKVVQANLESTGVYDNESPQYMDERVQTIDHEISEIDGKIVHLEDLMKRKGGSLDESLVEGVNGQGGMVDLNWENAIGILKSLDRTELDASLSYFLEDLLSIKVEQEDKLCKEQERENVISNLKRMVDVLRTAMLQYQQEEPQRVQRYLEEHCKVKDLADQMNHQQEERPPWQNLERSKLNDVLPRQPSPLRTLPVMDYSSVKSRPSGEFEKDGAEILTRKSELYDLPPIDGRQSPSRKDSHTRRHSPGDDLRIERDEERRKLNMGGSDVFQRLANAHTLASQVPFY